MPDTPPKDPPGVRDDTASGDPLLEAMEAARDAPAQPGGSDIAADDAGATAMAEKMGATIKKG